MSKHVYKSLPLDENGDADYSLEENQTWEFLLNRQRSLLKNRATDEFIKGIEILQFENKIPQHYAVTKILKSYTGWGVESVPALIQPELFFTLLANKKFPAANFIRIPKDIDYIMEPDVFHELFGHCPLLTVKPYADFMNEFGKIALTVDEKLKRRLFRLFWFTIEFGLMKINNSFRAYGGGILSSKSEIIYSVESNIPERVKLDPMVALRTPFRIDIMQPIYFYIESYDELFKLIELDIVQMAKESLKMDDFPAKFEKKKKMNDWIVNENEKCLEKEFHFKSYLKNISFVNAVAFLANKQNHHPEIHISYYKCVIKITTHDQNQITDKDHRLAKSIDELLLE